MSGLKRFLRIEGSRPERAPATSPGTSGASAARVPEPAAVPAPVPTSSAGEAEPALPSRMERRFPAAEGAPPLDAATSDEQPFTRCQHCERDHHRFAQRCAGCGTPLDTPSQRAYNAALWEKLLAERATLRPEENVPRHTLLEAREQVAVARALLEAQLEQGRPAWEGPMKVLLGIAIAAVLLAGLFGSRTGVFGRLLFAGALAALVRLVIRRRASRNGNLR